MPRVPSEPDRFSSCSASIHGCTESWKVTLVELAGAAAFTVGIAALTIGTVFVAVTRTLDSGTLPVSASGLLAISTGWRLMMHPTGHRSFLTDAVLTALAKRDNHINAPE